MCLKSLPADVKPSASYCVLGLLRRPHGRGLQVIYGIEMPFIIQAKDTANEKRGSGGDKFVCEIINIDPTGKFEVKGESRVLDRGDGLYNVFYTVPYPTKYEVHIKYVEPSMEDNQEPTLSPVGVPPDGSGNFNSAETDLPRTR